MQSINHNVFKNSLTQDFINKELKVYALPLHKSLDSYANKVFEQNLNVAKIMRFVFERVDKFWEKGNADYKHGKC